MPIVDYNSPISESLGYRTMAQLRTDLLVRLGYAGQTSAVPQGMTELLTSFLKSAHKSLMLRPNVPRQERFFTWTIVDGQKFYGLDTNEETGTRRLNQFDVKWVGIERDDVWYPLQHGISPELYSQTTKGLPQRYQINSSIEIWPVPDNTAQFLRIRGTFRAEAFSADGDTPTVDDELVFLYALSLAKAHYEHSDWQAPRGECELMIQGMIAGSHQTARYIPGECDQAYWVEPKPSVPFS